MRIEILPKKLLKTPAVWFALNAQIDGVDPMDTSPHGRAVYLCYIQRKQLDFMTTSVLAHASCPKDKDISKAIKMLQEMILPEDPEDVFRETARKQVALVKEKETSFIAEYADGMIRLKRVPNNA